MTPQELRNRLAVYAQEVRALATPLTRQLDTQDLALQLLRAADGAASNHRSAGRARSHAEFTAKLGVALDEADESQFWLEQVRASQLAERRLVDPLLAEAGELVAILTRSYTTAERVEEERKRRRLNRRPRPPRRRHERDGPMPDCR